MLSTGPIVRGALGDRRGGKLTAVSEDDLSDVRRRLRSVEKDAAAARVLAGAADRHVTEIRDFRQATTASFNALRADFVDIRQDFSDLRKDVNDLRKDVNDGWDHVDRGFGEIRGKLDATAAGQHRIVELIESLIDQQDR